MNPVEIETTKFKCPKCETRSIQVATRDGIPFAYHCTNTECKEKFEASWTLLGDEVSDGRLEQAIDSDGNTHDLGQFDVGQ